ncbi:hypothetical protein INT47_000158 [Mucor saturninus]|uniref:Uncharacterized protein n=1 Tax=Mucor saturninus TaxID=64648 RepID=A0A8H7VC26_9FUNG|nr:hypothetical protein INT47_000158 [Mucor saturninus]
MAKNSAWIWKRVKRTIPPPHMLYTGLYNLFLSFGSLKCVKYGLPLFDKVAWKSAVNVLVAVKDGHVSDPPDLSLYHVREHYKKVWIFGARPELTDCALTEYRLRHNTDASTLNRLGYEHKGHYEPWLNQVIEKLRASLHLSATQQTACTPNALDFCGSDEVFGICPISNDLMETLCVENNNTLTLGTIDLINTGKTCLSDYAILPVHTSEEKALFEDILVDNYQSSAEPNWSQFASRWNTSADGIAIFYKTPEHLKLYYNICQENKIVAKAKAKHSTIIQKVRSVISETMISQSIPPAINLPGRSNNTTVPFNRILVKI